MSEKLRLIHLDVGLCRYVEYRGRYKIEKLLVYLLI